MSRTGDVSLMQRIDVFDGLDDSEIELLLDLGEYLDIAQGQLLMRMGEENDALHIVLAGELEVFLPADGDAGRDREVTLNRLGAGGHSSEYSLVDRQPVSASVRARRDTRLMRIRRNDFESLAEGQHRLGHVFYRNLLRGTVHRLRLKDRVLDIIGF